MKEEKERKERRKTKKKSAMGRKKEIVIIVLVLFPLSLSKSQFVSYIEYYSSRSTQLIWQHDVLCKRKRPALGAPSSALVLEHFNYKWLSNSSTTAYYTPCN